MRTALLTAALLLCACGADADAGGEACSFELEAEEYLCCLPEKQYLREAACFSTLDEYDARVEERRASFGLNQCRNRHSCPPGGQSAL